MTVPTIALVVSAAFAFGSPSAAAKETKSAHGPADFSGRGANADAALVKATGSVTARPLADRFMDEVNVKDFGAKPDDGIDDTLAIQQALDTSRPVFFPAGLYLISQDIHVSGRFHVRGPGAILSSSKASGSLFVASGDLAGFSIRDITLKTTRHDLSHRGGALLLVDHQNVDGGLVDNVTFDTGSSYSNALLIAAQSRNTIKDITIRDCRFTGPSAAIEVVQHVDDVQRITGLSILNNRMRHNGLKDDQVAGFAISLSGPHNAISVVGNDIRGYPYAGIEITAHGSFTADYKVHSNTIVNTGRGIIIDKSTGGTGVRFSRVSIVGNAVQDARFFQRFEQLADSEIAANHIAAASAITSTDRQPEFVSFRYCDRVTITGNAINLDFPGSEHNKSVVTFLGFNGGTFSANRLRATGLSAIRFDGLTAPTADNVVVGNMIIHEHAGAYGAPVAFTGTGATRNLLADNAIYSKTALSYHSDAAGNVATGTKCYRTDIGRYYSNDYLVQTVTGATDLSKAVELRNIRLEGAPRSDFTLTLPSHDGIYTISNHTGQATLVRATSGGVPIPSGATANVMVSGGATTLF